MIGHDWRRTLALALSVLFVAGSAAEVYGFHDCPHHHPAPSGRSGAASGAASEGATPERQPLRSTSPGTCTCIGTCHGGAAAPTTALDRETPAVPRGETRRVHDPLPPASAPRREATLLLPYPTGPPAPNG